MGHKLDRFKDQIELFKAEGDSVRKIADKLTEASGEKIAPSTVQYFLAKQSEAPKLPRPDDLGERVESLENRLRIVAQHVEELQYLADRMDGRKALVWKPYGSGGWVLGPMRENYELDEYPVVYRSFREKWAQQLRDWTRRCSAWSRWAMRELWP